MRLFALGTSADLTWADWVGIGLVLASLVLGAVAVERFAPVTRSLSP